MLLNFQVIHSNCVSKVSRRKYFSSHISLYILSPKFQCPSLIMVYLLLNAAIKISPEFAEYASSWSKGLQCWTWILQKLPGLCSSLVPPIHTTPKFMFESWNMPAQTLHRSPWLAGRMCILKAFRSLTITPTLSHFTPWNHASRAYLGLLWKHGFSRLHTEICSKQTIHMWSLVPFQVKGSSHFHPEKPMWNCLVQFSHFINMNV